MVSLVKKIDNEVERGDTYGARGYLVVMSDSPSQDQATLARLHREMRIRELDFAVHDGGSGPERYKIAPEADVTVMMWPSQREGVKFNFAYRAGELDEAEIKKIVKAVRANYGDE